MPKIGTTAHSSTHDAMWLVHTALSTSEVAGLTGRVTEAIHRRHHKSMLRGKQVHARMTRSTSSTIQPTRGSSQLDRPAHRACSRVVLEHLQCIPLTARITPLLRLPPPTLPGAEGSPPCMHASSRGDAHLHPLLPAAAAPSPVVIHLRAPLLASVLASLRSHLCGIGAPPAGRTACV